MKRAVVAFTKTGAELALLISNALGQCTPYAPPQYARYGLEPLEKTLPEWTKQAFEEYSGIIFVGACGIAARAIAPCIESKLTDPAVVVTDEKARYAVSLLSGHMGGANKLAREVADAIGAQPVITTATDLNGIFAVDEWAVQNGLIICNPGDVKHISGALLKGQPIGIQTRFAVAGKLPDCVTADSTPQYGICVSTDTREQPYDKTLLLMPVILHMGIGCRKGVTEQQIADAVLPVLEQNGLTMQAFRDISSIDLKADETGLLAFCAAYKKPFNTYEARQLMRVEASIDCSDFVKSITGADNVCERAALYSAGQNAKLLVAKQIRGAVTMAVAIEQWEMRFEY